MIRPTVHTFNDEMKNDDAFCRNRRLHRSWVGQLSVGGCECGGVMLSKSMQTVHCSRYAP